MGTWEELQAVKGHTQICTLTSLVAACGVEYGLEWEIYYKNEREILVYLLIHLIQHLLNIYCMPGIVIILRMQIISLNQRYPLKLGCGDWNLLYLYHPIW